MTSATALIAEDEPLLAQALRDELARQWPALRVLATATHGAEAVELALSHRPDVLFLDIRMPGMSGLEAAAALADRWEADIGAFPLLVFVTAFDQYALDAFEREAVDYVLKPVRPERLARTVERLRRALAGRAGGALPSEQVLRQLQTLLDTPRAGAPLRHVQAAVGQEVHLVPVDAMLYFEAADKYVRAVSAEREYLLRTPLKQLLAQLDPEQFWQVHRGTVVRADAIASVSRDERDRVWLRLRGRDERLAVSRVYAARFKAM